MTTQVTLSASRCRERRSVFEIARDKLPVGFSVGLPVLSCLGVYALMRLTHLHWCYHSMHMCRQRHHEMLHYTDASFTACCMKVMLDLAASLKK